MGIIDTAKSVTKCCGCLSLKKGSLATAVALVFISVVGFAGTIAADVVVYDNYDVSPDQVRAAAAIGLSVPIAVCLASLILSW